MSLSDGGGGAQHSDGRVAFPQLSPPGTAVVTSVIRAAVPHSVPLAIDFLIAGQGSVFGICKQKASLMDCQKASPHLAAVHHHWGHVLHTMVLILVPLYPLQNSSPAACCLTFAKDLLALLVSGLAYPSVAEGSVLPAGMPVHDPQVGCACPRGAIAILLQLAFILRASSAQGAFFLELVEKGRMRGALHSAHSQAAAQSPVMMLCTRVSQSSNATPQQHGSPCTWSSTAPTGTARPSLSCSPQCSTDRAGTPGRDEHSQESSCCSHRDTGTQPQGFLAWLFPRHSPGLPPGLTTHLCRPAVAGLSQLHHFIATHRSFVGHVRRRPVQEALSFSRGEKTLKVSYAAVAEGFGASRVPVSRG